jgi:RNA-binding protein YlmH
MCDVVCLSAPMCVFRHAEFKQMYLACSPQIFSFFLHHLFHIGDVELRPIRVNLRDNATHDKKSLFTVTRVRLDMILTYSIALSSIVESSPFVILNV